MPEVSKINCSCAFYDIRKGDGQQLKMLYSSDSGALPVMILGKTSCFQCINGLSDMEKVCRTEKVSRRLGLLN